MEITFYWSIQQSGIETVKVDDLGFTENEWKNLTTSEQNDILQKYLDENIQTLELSPYIDSFNAGN